MSYAKFYDIKRTGEGKTSLLHTDKMGKKPQTSCLGIGLYMIETPCRKKCKTDLRPAKRKANIPGPRNSHSQREGELSGQTVVVDRFLFTKF